MSTELQTATSVKITDFDQIRGGAFVFPDGNPGYLLYHPECPDSPIYVTPTVYSAICLGVALEHQAVSIHLCPIVANHFFPQTGYVGAILD